MENFDPEGHTAQAVAKDLDDTDIIASSGFVHELSNIFESGTPFSIPLQ